MAAHTHSCPPRPPAGAMWGHVGLRKGVLPLSLRHRDDGKTQMHVTIHLSSANVRCAPTVQLLYPMEDGSYSCTTADVRTW